MLTTCYLFLGGAGAGACVVLAVFECATVRHRAGSRELAHWAVSWLALPSELFARAWPCCFVLLAAGAACLVADVGRPDRLATLFLMPHASAMSAGAVSLACVLVCSGVFSLASLLDGLQPPRVLVVALALFGAASGAVTMVYTGVLLQSLASVLAYGTPLVPALFTLSSLSCGIGVVFAALSFVEARYPHVASIGALVHADSVLLLAEAVCLALFAAWLLSDGGTRAGGFALVAGELSGYFWLGLVGVGLAVPFMLERMLTHASFRVQLLWTAACLLAGGFVLRFCMVGLAAFDVTRLPSSLFGMVMAS